MYEEMTQKFFDQFQNAGEPMRRFAELSLTQAEKLAHFQLDASRAYVDLGIEQLRAATSVRDVRGLQDYVSRQQEVASTVGRRLTDDVETLAGMGKDFSEAAGKLAQENVDAVRPRTSGKAAA
ncbi:phasin family protein [Arhodomonas sp. AD133]|uniref:phasin family protein n=1 Tax=Arhodomonas sp. AD133 TaxID=3415009 RepID=UPI003EB76F5C